MDVVSINSPSIPAFSRHVGGGLPQPLPSASTASSAALPTGMEDRLGIGVAAASVASSKVAVAESIDRPKKPAQKGTNKRSRDKEQEPGSEKNKKPKYGKEHGPARVNPPRRSSRAAKSSHPAATPTSKEKGRMASKDTAKQRWKNIAMYGAIGLNMDYGWVNHSQTSMFISQQIPGGLSRRAVRNAGDISPPTILGLHRPSNECGALAFHRGEARSGFRQNLGHLGPKPRSHLDKNEGSDDDQLGPGSDKILARKQAGRIFGVLNLYEMAGGDANQHNSARENAKIGLFWKLTASRATAGSDKIWHIQFVGILPSTFQIPTGPFVPAPSTPFQPIWVFSDMNYS
ncbi:hypothetical protein B0H10DRAFT_2192572 [Mycena sp. CBHHK59/15]|nr:hypothetical protein B0H10DRAFT_2192572 [Mycena sp. CBHHK59/15]